MRPATWTHLLEESSPWGRELPCSRAAGSRISEHQGLACRCTDAASTPATEWQHVDICQPAFLPWSSSHGQAGDLLFNVSSTQAPGAPKTSRCGSSWAREGHDGGQNVDMFQGPYDSSALTLAHHGSSSETIETRIRRSVTFPNGHSTLSLIFMPLPSVLRPVLFFLQSLFLSSSPGLCLFCYVLFSVVVFGLNILSSG